MCLLELGSASGAVRKSIKLPAMSYPAGLALGPTRLYLADYEEGEVVELGYPSGEEAQRWRVAPRLCGLEWVESRLCAAEEVHHTLLWLDPSTRRVVQTEALPSAIAGHGLTGLAWDGAGFWLGDESEGVVLQLRRTETS